MMTVDALTGIMLGDGYSWIGLCRGAVSLGVCGGRDVRVRYLCSETLPDTRSADSGRVREEESREDAKRPGARSAERWESATVGALEVEGEALGG